MDVAINGVVEDSFMRRINVHTSSGIGFSGKKENILPITLEAPDKLKREPTHELKREIMKLIKCYEAGSCAEIIFKASLKDEPRPIEKVQVGNTRIFYVGQTPYLILCRMFLMPLFTDMVENGEDYCTAIGIDMHRDTPKLVEQLLKISQMIIEGDFSSFDITIPFGLRWAAVTLIYRLCKRNGYGPYALRILMGLLSNFMSSFILFIIDLIKVSIQQSGAYGTAEFNSLCMLILLMYIWYMDDFLCQFDFFDHVFIRTYGDDFIGAISNFAKPFFNNLYIKEKCMLYFNMKYTPASKGLITLETLSLEDASFLKRRFKWHIALNRYVSPLSTVSIARSLSWYIPSGAVSREKQLSDTCKNALWEYFFHCDNKIQYSKFRDTILRTNIELFGLEDSDIVTFPTWEFLVEALA
jgi:hypothetical protein